MKKKKTSTVTYAIVGVVALGAAVFAWKRWGSLITSKTGQQPSENKTGATVAPPPQRSPLTAADLGYKSGGANPTVTSLVTGFQSFGAQQLDTFKSRLS